MSANGADGVPDYIAFDPAIAKWFGGVRFVGVTNSTGAIARPQHPFAHARVRAR
jgi:hypothetical protein